MEGLLFMSVVNFVLLGFFVWLIALTIGIIFLLPFFYKISKGGKEPDVRKILERLLAEEEKRNKSIDEIWSYIKKVEKKAEGHIQKVGLVRFNPFSETGGDHSFSLALMTGENNGFVITGLHTRERTRIYLKPVKLGRSELSLSEEEKKAIEKALKV